jgi:hypothetical protein
MRQLAKREVSRRSSRSCETDDRTLASPATGRTVLANCLGFALALVVGVARGDEGSDWATPFTPDEHTVVLYHFDEGHGNETHDACGDRELTLRPKETALWGSRPGFGTTARFDRQDAHVLFGPVNNDKLQLRKCPEEWTIELWVRYSGPGGAFPSEVQRAFA